MVLVDAENVRRSTWPNISADELVELVERWTAAGGARAVVVFDGSAPAFDTDDGAVEVVSTGRESADDWIAREAAALAAHAEPYWLVTSDRELRTRAGDGAERIVGGASFARTLLDLHR